MEMYRQSISPKSKNPRCQSQAATCPSEKRKGYKRKDPLSLSAFPSRTLHELSTRPQALDIAIGQLDRRISKCF